MDNKDNVKFLDVSKSKVAVSFFIYVHKTSDMESVNSQFIRAVVMVVNGEKACNENIKTEKQLH